MTSSKLYGLLVGSLLTLNGACLAETTPSSTAHLTISNSTDKAINIKVEAAEGNKEMSTINLPAKGETRLTINEEDLKCKLFSVSGTMDEKVKVPSVIGNTCKNLFIGKDYQIVFTSTMGTVQCNSTETSAPTA